MQRDSAGVTCPICRKAMVAQAAHWSFFCESCDYWSSTLSPVNTIIPQGAGYDIATDGGNPIAHLDGLRDSNYDKCLGQLVAIRNPAECRLLEVGCGPGGFLQRAQQAGFRAVGIEPSEALMLRARAKGVEVHLGLFPQCLREDERFDVIVFNDVFEHLPDPVGVIATCRRHLTPAGLIVINVPNAHGLFFRLARLGAIVGVARPWERMWQKMFYTPHLHYFTPASLESLCVSSGLEPMTQPIWLQSLSTTGLWSRIRLSQEASLAYSIAMYVAALLLGVVAPLCESDCMLRIFRNTSRIDLNW